MYGQQWIEMIESQHFIIFLEMLYSWIYYWNSCWIVLICLIVEYKTFKGITHLYNNVLLPYIQFLYALPQKEGYEFFLGQWSDHELHFTSLINVQVTPISFLL